MALVAAALPANISGAEDAAVGTDTLPPLERRLCVLPLGDSITQGDDDHATWRHPLWQSLLDARPASTEVLFTGQMVNHYGEDIGMIHPQAAHARAYDTGTVEFPFPPHHEGHWGWTTDQILQGLEGGQSGSGRLGAWVEQYSDVCTPSCVLVHIGTNDVVRRTASTETILANIRTMITQLSAKFPSTLRVLVATPIPSCSAQVGTELAPAIRSAFASDANLGLPSDVATVKMVEMTEGFEQSWLYDGCHPNEEGEDFMAGQWFTAVQAHCPGIEVGPNEPRLALRKHASRTSGGDSSSGCYLRSPAMTGWVGVVMALTQLE